MVALTNFIVKQTKAFSDEFAEAMACHSRRAHRYWAPVEIDLCDNTLRILEAIRMWPAKK